MYLVNVAEPSASNHLQFRPFLRIVIRQPPAVLGLLVAYKHIYQLPTNQASDYFLKKLDLTIRTDIRQALAAKNVSFS